jgi:hypothetical protein
MTFEKQILAGVLEEVPKQDDLSIIYMMKI